MRLVVRRIEAALRRDRKRDARVEEGSPIRRRRTRDSAAGPRPVRGRFGKIRADVIAHEHVRGQPAAPLGRGDRRRLLRDAVRNVVVGALVDGLARRRVRALDVPVRALPCRLAGANAEGVWSNTRRRTSRSGMPVNGEPRLLSRARVPFARRNGCRSYDHARAGRELVYTLVP
jgi:hypothetical protein